jgi:hypothetical protein
MKKITSIAAAVLLTTASAVNAESYATEAHYKVSITNITKGISFTPLIAATHKPALSLFELGEPASNEIVQIAEGGNTAPLAEQLNSSSHVFSTATSEGLLMPGETVMLDISSPKNLFWRGQLSLAAMLLPTNDSFISLNGVRLPVDGHVTYLANAYDAGSEVNDESCANIPGPSCGGEGYSPAVNGEGFVYPSPGIHGEADLSVEDYGWSGPVAKVSIARVK